MLEHLVQSHLGGYYISEGEEEEIEQYCETCGDYDLIVSSWNPEEENARINALLRFFMMSVLNTREDIHKRVDEYDNNTINANDIISILVDDIEFNEEEINSIASYLFENKDITKEEYEKIIKISSFEKKRQIKMIKHFEKSIFPNNKKEKVKSLKK